METVSFTDAATLSRLPQKIGKLTKQTKKKKEQGNLVVSAELIMEICHRKEFQSWRFER